MMYRTTKILLAATLPATALVVAGEPAGATTPPSEPSGTDHGVPVPVDFVAIVDDTGTITVEVPGSWTDIDTAPSQAVPFIEAAPDRAAFRDSFDVPGLTYVAAPFIADTEAAARQAGLQSGCDDEAIEPYDDGVFVGSELTYTRCGPTGAAELHVIAANPQNQAFTALLRIQITGPDQLPILQGIKATFNMTPVVGATGSSLPGVSAPAVQDGGAFPPPAGEVAADWTRLVDDTETVAIAVPAAWTDVDVIPKTGEDGRAVPWISATTDGALFIPPAGTEDTFSVPGVIARALPFEGDTAARVEASAFFDLCSPGPLQNYDDGRFVGHLRSFTDCGGSATRIVQIVANPADSSFTADLLIQLTGAPDDDATLNGLLLSFGQANVGTAPETTTPG